MKLGQYLGYGIITVLVLSTAAMCTVIPGIITWIETERLDLSILASFGLPILYVVICAVGFVSVKLGFFRLWGD